MKVNLKEKILNEFNEPWKTERGDLTLGKALGGALFAPEQIDKDEKADRYTWGMRLMNSDSEDMSQRDMERLLEITGKMSPTVLYGRICEIFERYKKNASNETGEHKKG